MRDYEPTFWWHSASCMNSIECISNLYRSWSISSQLRTMLWQSRAEQHARQLPILLLWSEAVLLPGGEIGNYTSLQENVNVLRLHHKKCNDFFFFLFQWMQYNGNTPCVLCVRFYFDLTECIGVMIGKISPSINITLHKSLAPSDLKQIILWEFVKHHAELSAGMT